MARLQLEAGGVFLDLYDTDLPKITLSITDAVSFEATTAFSQQFRVPATTHNTQLFETAFMINGLDFDVTAKQNAVILVDGNEFKRGEIRLQNIYINEQTGRIDYGIVFIGELRDLVTNIEDSRLCDMSLLHLTHSRGNEDITGSWDAYPTTPVGDDGGLLSGSVIYPLIDFGNTYADDGTTNETRIALNVPAINGGSFDDSGEPMDPDRFRPMIRAKEIWDEIFSEAGYMYESDFLDSNLFKHLYVSAFGDEAVATPDIYSLATANTFGTWNGGLYNIPSSIQIRIDGSEGDSQNAWDVPNDRYIVPEDDDYNFTTRVNFQNEVDDPGSGTIEVRLRVRKNDTTDIYTSTWFEVSFSGVQNNTISYEQGTETLVAGDVIEWFYEIQNGSNHRRTLIRNGTYIRVNGEFTDQVSPAKGLSCDTTQLQFLKDVRTKFNLVLNPIKGKPNTFKIEPWDEFVGTGDVKDWTNKIDHSKDVVITPLFNEQVSRIEFKDKAGSDYLSVLNEEQFQESYGQANVVNRNELLVGKKEITSELTSVPSTQIVGAEDNTTIGGDNFIIPQLCVTKPADYDGTTIIKYEPIKPYTRLYWYNGMKHTGTAANRDVTWYVENNISGTPDSFTKFPMVSEFNEWGDRDNSWQGLDTLTKTISWQKENSYIQFDLAQTLLGDGVYDLYWANYITSLYDRYARRLTAYFVLDGDDIIDFDFSDVIFVKDTYYYVQKIYDAVIGEKRSIKVDLIKLPQFKPDADNFIQTLPWEDMVPVWNTWSVEWEES